MATVPSRRYDSDSKRPPTQVIVRTPPRDDFDAVCENLSALLKLSPITVKILVSRGIVDEAQARAFLLPSLRDHIPDPHTIKNIEPAAEMILESVRKKERITIYCDFDVDGTSSGAQLYLFLRALGAHVSTYTPSRFVEGYGLVSSAVEKLAQTGTKLLVTADCGINSHVEMKLARKLGLKTIVVDHHLPSGDSPADVVVNPAQEGCPFQEYKLAAAGLVWMLLIVLRRRAAALVAEKKLILKGAMPEPKEFLDLAVLGTVCDMVPLVGLNRVIASRGVEAIKRSTRPGIVALKQVSGVSTNPKFGAGHIAFNLGPRINAAGRLGDANDVIELLTTEDSIQAKTIAERIDRMNEKRKAIEEDVRTRCVEQILTGPGGSEGQPAFAIFGPTFHVGVIGIAAQRLVEQFYRPAAVMAPGETTIRGKAVPVVKGSVRSIRGFHVADALHKLSGLLLSGGGHAEAGGFSVLPENREEFSNKFIALAGELLGPEHLERKKFADAEVNLGQIDFDLVSELSSLAPFGIGNPSPLLVARNVAIESVTSISAGHLRLLLRSGSTQAVGMAWGKQGHPLIKKGSEISIAFIPELNSYRGITSVQLNIQEIW